jgi:hypothetical protein
VIRIKSFQITLLFVAMIATSCQAGDISSRQTIDSRDEKTVLPSITSPFDDSTVITDVPHPTRTPVTDIPKTPGVLDCSDIVKAHQESTDVEWEGAKILLRGSEFYYAGLVYAVTENDEVHLTGSMCHATLHHVPHEIAINLSNGQYIEGYGTIASVGFNRGEDVDIEVNPDLLFVGK